MVRFRSLGRYLGVIATATIVGAAGILGLHILARDRHEVARHRAQGLCEQRKDHQCFQPVHA
jgi:hypothetical protein